MNEHDMVQIPYIVYEGTQARNERTTKRLIVVIILTITLLFVSNGLWLYAWMQYDYTSTDEDYWQDGDGYNNINTGDQGDVINGATIPSTNEDTQAEEWE